MKFKDAELIGVPTIVDGRPRPGRRRGRGQGPGHRRAAGRRGRGGRRPPASAWSGAELRAAASTPSSSTGAARSPAGTTSTSTRSRSRWPRRSPGRRRADDDRHAWAARLHAAGDTIWGRSRDHQQSSTIADLFDEAGLDHDPALLTAYYAFWEPHTATDPEVRAAVGGAAGERDQGRRAVQHDLAARLARGVLPPRRRARPGRRRRLHQRDPVDQAVAARLRGGDGGRRRRPTRRGASTSATGSSTTSGAPPTPGCGPCTSRTAGSPAARSATPRARPDAVVETPRRGRRRRRPLGADRTEFHPVGPSPSAADLRQGGPGCRPWGRRGRRPRRWPAPRGTPHAHHHRTASYGRLRRQRRRPVPGRPAGHRPGRRRRRRRRRASSRPTPTTRLVVGARRLRPRHPAGHGRGAAADRPRAPTGCSTRSAAGPGSRGGDPRPRPRDGGQGRHGQRHQLADPAPGRRPQQDLRRRASRPPRPTPASPSRSPSVDRFYNNTWHKDGASRASTARQTRQGGADALNMWLVDFKYLGIATFPWDYQKQPGIDGIRVHYDSLPGGSIANFNLGETATHEAGHWLGLYHTFQGGCTELNDEVSDTPAQSSPTSGCPAGPRLLPAARARPDPQLHGLLLRQLLHRVHRRPEHPDGRHVRPPTGADHRRPARTGSLTSASARPRARARRCCRNMQCRKVGKRPARTRRDRTAHLCRWDPDAVPTRASRSRSAVSGPRAHPHRGRSRDFLGR